MGRAFGLTDILVNNAGLRKHAPFDQMTLAVRNAGDRREPDGPVPARDAVRAFKRRRINKTVCCAAGKTICMSSRHQSQVRACRRHGAKGGQADAEVDRAGAGGPAHPGHHHLARHHSDYINGIGLYVDGRMTLYPGFEAGG